MAGADDEGNRLTARMGRYGSLGVGAAGAAGKIAAGRLRGSSFQSAATAEVIASALGRIKGPAMKLAQLAAAIPGAIPPQWEPALAKLQANAPQMGPRFVQRRMRRELGANWREAFAEFDFNNAYAASLGQVHRATSHGGEQLAVKLQYPDMASAIEADLQQFRLLLGIIHRSGLPLDLSQAEVELSTRLREELDYEGERKRMAVYGHIFADDWQLSIPRAHEHLCTDRLLTMDWMAGKPSREYVSASQEVRNGIAVAAFRAWWGPLFSHALIHGDPHPGNYLVRVGENIQPSAEGYAPAAGIAPVGLSLLDFGCVRFFDATCVRGVVNLYRALKAGDSELAAQTYELWGYKNLSPEMNKIMEIWARFIYAALLEDRDFDCSDEASAVSYGREQAMQVRKELSKVGVLQLPREFILLDRAALGMGGLFMRMRAKLNFHRIFEQMIESFSEQNANQRSLAVREKYGIDVPL